MAITPFLAMTAAEIASVSHFPPKIAWMACHFSPYSTGLTNLPSHLPSKSILVLDDSIPHSGHDFDTVSKQIIECVDIFSCHRVLLDFQRSDIPDTTDFIKHLIQVLPCPTIVSEHYAKELSCPVFLPPVPPSVVLREYLAPWKEREIWLEIGLVGEILTLTEQGCRNTHLIYPEADVESFSDRKLHCHYNIDTTEKSARFTLWRTVDDWIELLADAESLCVAGAIGLFQELQQS